MAMRERKAAPWHMSTMESPPPEEEGSEPDGNEVEGIPRHLIDARANGPDRLALLVDGALLAGRPGALHAYDVPHPVEGMAFTKEAWLEVRGGSERSLWDVTRAPEPGPHPGAAVAVGASKDGAFTLDRQGTWRRWNDGRTWRAHRWPLLRPAALAMSPDGTMVAGARDGRLVRWSPPSAPQVIDDQPAIHALAMGPDGSLAVAHDEEIRFFDPKGRPVPRRIAVETRPRALALDGEGRLVAVLGGGQPATALGKGRLALWEPRASEPSSKAVPMDLPSGSLLALALDGTRLAVAHRIQVAVFSLDEGKTVTLDAQGVSALAFDEAHRVITASSSGEVVRWNADGRRVNAALALLPDGRLVTSSGVLSPDDRTTSDDGPGGGWLEAVQREARRASQRQAGAPLCVMTLDGNVEVWSTGADRRMGRREVDELYEVLGLPSGCAVRTRADVLLTSGGEPQALGTGPARALGWAEQRLLVVTDKALISFSESGERLEEHAFSGDRGKDVTAVTQTGSTVVMGHGDGHLSWLSTGGDMHLAGDETAAPSPVTALAAGPAGPASMGTASSGIVAVGRDDGTVTLLLGADGVPWRGRVRGPVRHLRLREGALLAASAGGDLRRWSLEALERDRCALIEDLRTETAALNPDRPLPALPENHPCRR
jgi:hypothetical protein